jgi:antitoxin ParD1/3/4
MNVELSSEMAKLVSRIVESGRYRSAGEVVEEALELLQNRDATQESRIQELRRAIDEGLADLDKGNVHSFDRESLKQLKREARERLAGQPR